MGLALWRAIVQPPCQLAQTLQKMKKVKKTNGFLAKKWKQLKNHWKISFLGPHVAKNLIFPMVFPFFIFLQENHWFFYFFRFLQHLGLPAGQAAVIVTQHPPGRPAQILQKMKKWKNQWFSCKKWKKLKKHWKNKVFGDRQPQKPYFSNAFGHIQN